MKYYLTVTARRKNAKRHIAHKDKDLHFLRALGRTLTDRYNVAIYDGRWNLVEEVI